MKCSLSIICAIIATILHQSITSMGPLSLIGYNKALSTAPHLKKAFTQPRAFVVIEKPLLIHLIVHATKSQSSKKIRKIFSDLHDATTVIHKNQNRDLWTKCANAKAFYYNILTHVPWNGTIEQGRKYPIVLNDIEGKIFIIPLQSKSIPSLYPIEIMAFDYNFYEDKTHHNKICDIFNELYQLSFE